MAKKTDIDADLTLELDGKSLTPEKFLRGVRAFFALVNDVTRAAAGPKEFVHWVVQVKSGSNLIGIEPRNYNVAPAVLNGIYSTIQHGIESIEDEAAVPVGVPESALKHIRDLAALVGTTDGDDTKVRVWAKKQPVKVTHKAVAHVAELFAEEYEDFGTIEGRIQVISDQGTLHVFVMEPIKGRRVRVHFDEEMLPNFIAAFRKRVEIAGRIKYRRDGTQISISATALSEFPDSKDLPSIREMRGIFKEKA
jgi:hypothetical protein